MGYRLRTLLIVGAVVPPAAGMFWWYVRAAEYPLAALPLVFTFGAIAAIVVTWLCELADYLECLTGGK